MATKHSKLLHSECMEEVGKEIQKVTARAAVARETSIFANLKRSEWYFGIGRRRGIGHQNLYFSGKDVTGFLPTGFGKSLRVDASVTPETERLHSFLARWQQSKKKTKNNNLD